MPFWRCGRCAAIRHASVASMVVATAACVMLGLLTGWGLTGCGRMTPLSQGGPVSPSEWSGPGSGLVIRMADEGDSTERAVWKAAVPGAMQRVTAVWGVAMRAEVELIVPSDEARRAVLVGGRTSAMAVTVFRQGARTSASGERPVIVMQPRSDLDARERVIVLAHELSHVVQRQSGSQALGAWPLEGTAMLTQYLGEAYQRHVDTDLVRERIRSGAPPAAPPGAGEFTGGEASRRAYQEAWTLCLYLEHLRGRAAVVAFARDIAAGAGTGQALRSRFGLGEQDLVRGWIAWVRSWA